MRSLTDRRRAAREAALRHLHVEGRDAAHVAPAARFGHDLLHGLLALVPVRFRADELDAVLLVFGAQGRAAPKSPGIPGFSRGRGGLHKYGNL